MAQLCTINYESVKTIFGAANNLPPHSGQIQSQCDNNEHVQYSAHLPYKAGGVQLLSAGQVCNVVSVVVDALHAAFKVLPPSSHRLPTVWHPSKTQLERDIGQRGKKKKRDAKSH